MFQVFAGIVALSSLLSFINKKVLKLPDTIGLMVLAIITSVLLASLSFLDPEIFERICAVVDEIDFRTILFDFLLSFLLFAGAIHVNLHNLLEERGPVLIYASLGVVLSTLIIGLILYYLSAFAGFPIPLIYTLLFGALISPTDPIAVLSLLKKAGAPKDIEIKIIGESLFNDGVGIVVFISLLSFATMQGGEELTASHVLFEFMREAFGGILMGLVLGLLGKWFFGKIYDSPLVAVHISIALVMGGYALSSVLHVSGALAMVVLGLMIGNYLHRSCESKAMIENMTVFWKVLDEILNAILFVLIGIEIISLDFKNIFLLLAAITIPLVLFARFSAIALSNIFLKPDHRSGIPQISVLTWAGLRGGISIALALSLPENDFREVIIFITYTVVVFSILIQGLSIDKLVSKTLTKTDRYEG